MNDTLKAIIFALLDLLLVLAVFIFVKSSPILSILIAAVAQVAFIVFIVILILHHNKLKTDKKQIKPTIKPLEKPKLLTKPKILTKLKPLIKPKLLKHKSKKIFKQKKQKPVFAPPQTVEKVMNIEDLRKYIKENLKKGFTKQKIFKKLKTVGWPDKEIGKIFQEL